MCVWQYSQSICARFELIRFNVYQSYALSVTDGRSGQQTHPVPRLFGAAGGSTPPKTGAGAAAMTRRVIQ